jgi:hypothetical protein
LSSTLGRWELLKLCRTYRRVRNAPSGQVFTLPDACRYPRDRLAAYPDHTEGNMTLSVPHLCAVDATTIEAPLDAPKTSVSLLYPTRPLQLLPELAAMRVEAEIQIKKKINGKFVVIGTENKNVTIGLAAAVFLQQLFYWQNWKREWMTERAPSLFESKGRVWVWNNYNQWITQMPFFTPRTLTRLIKRLHLELKLIDVLQPNKSAGDRTNFYSINETRFAKLRKLLAEQATQRTKDWEEQKNLPRQRGKQRYGRAYEKRSLEDALM